MTAGRAGLLRSSIALARVAQTDAADMTIDGGRGRPDATAASASPTPTSAPHSRPSNKDASTDSACEPSSDRVAKPPGYPRPTLRIEVRDLDHDGASVFFDSVNVSTVMHRAVGNVQRLLYGRDALHADPETHCPPTRSVTLILRAMDGVAYTTGSELDGDHKEIHFSLQYIAGVKPRGERVTAEITGVLTHELVHCYQWNGRGTCPGGLVEGIADWVRLQCELSPPHWKRDPAAVGRWDAGYQHTAYFLDFLEQRFGGGTVRRINEKLRLSHYREADFWSELFGHSVEKLWKDYVDDVVGE